MDLRNFFEPKSVAVLGVSKTPEKIGSVIFKNLVDSGFKGEVFAVNPNEDFVLGYKSYHSVNDIKEKIDLAVIAVPSKAVLSVIKECAQKRIKNILMVTAGFKESGNVKLDQELVELLSKYGMKFVGPNCLGIIDNYHAVDTLFIPLSRLQRPRKGNISFVTQSGAFGSSVLDLISAEGYGLSKFVSYGNSLDVDESDILDYLDKDKTTDLIVMYIEGVKNGKKFLETLKRMRKPVLAIKGGKFSESNNSTLSHTGSLAGAYEVYQGVFHQANVVSAESIQDIFDFLRIFEKNIKIRGNRVQIITNGGGHGVISSDAIIHNGLKLAELSESTKKKLKGSLPSIATVSNPLDLVGDADDLRYKLAIETCLHDKNNDVLLVNLLYQTPRLSKSIVDVIGELNHKNLKPIVVVSTGSYLTGELKESLEKKSIPCFQFPENAVKSIKAVYDYYRNRK
ncbi:CoA-binding protein [Candidatus Woesearchaeota archaeon]|nr:CoA-binding protein [Candidatus Woesearchaeota archaeon]